MRVICCFSDHSEAKDWANALGTALPGASVVAWEPGTPPADYAVVWRPAPRLFEEQRHLKAVFNAGAGVDALTGLDLPTGVPIIRLEDAGMAEQMCDYVLHAVLHHFREFDEFDIQARRNEWTQKPPRDKSDFPVGILGAGLLGTAVAKAISARGFAVHAWARTPRAQNAFPFPLYAGPDQFEHFCAASRMLVCLLPLTGQTRGILNQACFNAMRAGGYVINAARGGHLVYADLVNAIEDGQIAGATLDVFEIEPLPADHELWQHPRIRVTPHIAAAATLDVSVSQVAAKIIALQAGESVSGTVVPHLGY